MTLGDPVTPIGPAGPAGPAGPVSPFLQDRISNDSEKIAISCNKEVLATWAPRKLAVEQKLVMERRLVADVELAMKDFCIKKFF